MEQAAIIATATERLYGRLGELLDPPDMPGDFEAERWAIEEEIGRRELEASDPAYIAEHEERSAA